MRRSGRIRVCAFSLRSKQHSASKIGSKPPSNLEKLHFEKSWSAGRRAAFGRFRVADLTFGRFRVAGCRRWFFLPPKQVLFEDSDSTGFKKGERRRAPPQRSRKLEKCILKKTRLVGAGRRGEGRPPAGRRPKMRKPTIFKMHFFEISRGLRPVF